MGAVLAGKSGVKLIDLRGNKIGKGAIRVLAEALERSERVRHVYVHAGGKIEALGSGKWAQPRDQAGKGNDDDDAPGNAPVETVCVVDIRDNNPESTSFPYELQTVQQTSAATQQANSAASFSPKKLLAGSGVPSKNQLESPPRASDMSLSVKVSKTNKTTLSKKLNESQPLTELEKKKLKIKQHEEKMMAIRESAWHGRAETMESRTDYQPVKSESLRLRKKNGAQRGELPPLTEQSNYNSTDRPVRSAPQQGANGGGDTDNEYGFGTMELQFDSPAEGLIMPDGEKGADGKVTKGGPTKKKKKAKKVLGETAKRLEDSPFGQPVAPN